jgi:hypothetical protein
VHPDFSGLAGLLPDTHVSNFARGKTLSLTNTSSTSRQIIRFISRKFPVRRNPRPAETQSRLPSIEDIHFEHPPASHRPPRTRPMTSRHSRSVLECCSPAQLWYSRSSSSFGAPRCLGFPHPLSPFAPRHLTLHIVQTATSSPCQFAKCRLCLLATGYALMLLGALSIFSAPLYISFLFLLVGAALSVFASFRTPSMTPPPMTKLSWVVLLAGSGILLALLNVIGENTVRHWTPHPAGYGPAWFACFQAFRHFRHIITTSVRPDPLPR